MEDFRLKETMRVKEKRKGKPTLREIIMKFKNVKDKL